MNICEKHKNVIPKNYCPVCLTEALLAFMKAWIQDKPRSMHDLKTDMDVAYEEAKKALNETV